MTNAFQLHAHRCTTVRKGLGEPALTVLDRDRCRTYQTSRGYEGARHHSARGSARSMSGSRRVAAHNTIERHDVGGRERRSDFDEVAVQESNRTSLSTPCCLVACRFDGCP
jgi:hypothetical protein